MGYYTIWLVSVKKNFVPFWELASEPKKCAFRILIGYIGYNHFEREKHGVRVPVKVVPPLEIVKEYKEYKECVEGAQKYFRG